MTSTITKQEYSVYYGISELKRLQTAHSLAFDTETLQLQPEEGKLPTEKNIGISADGKVLRTQPLKGKG